MSIHQERPHLFTQTLNFVVMLLLVSSFVSALYGEVIKVADDTLVMQYDQERRNISSVLAWGEDTPIQFYETDREVNVEYKILNNNFFELTLTNSPYGKEQTYPIMYCTMNEIADYDRYRYRQNFSKCELFNYVYKLDDVRVGQKRNVRVPPIIDGNNAFKWSVGKGADGGGGIPVCEGIGVLLTRNQSTGYVPYYDYEMEGYAIYVGDVSTGCTLSAMYWEFYNNLNQWRTIPTTNNTQSLDCKGVACTRLSSVAFLTPYTKVVRCDLVGNFSTRIRLVGTVSGSATTAYSTVGVQECKVYVPPVVEEDDGFGYWIIFVFFLMFGTLFGLVVFGGFRREKS